MKDLRKWSILTYEVMRVTLYDQYITTMAKGYRQMLCDRMPQTLDIALRWCKAKNKWVDYVYDNTIKKYPQKERSRAVKQVLGQITYYNIDEIELNGTFEECSEKFNIKYKDIFEIK